MGREEGGGFRMDFLFKLIVENKEKKKKRMSHQTNDLDVNNEILRE